MLNAPGSSIARAIRAKAEKDAEGSAAPAVEEPPAAEAAPAAETPATEAPAAEAPAAPAEA